MAYMRGLNPICIRFNYYELFVLNRNDNYKKTKTDFYQKEE